MDSPGVQLLEAASTDALARIRARVVNTPLAITPDKLNAILAGIGPRLGLAPPAPLAAVAPPRVRRAEYRVTEHGVAIVPIMGTIVRRNASGVTNSSGLVSTEAVGQILRTAAHDPMVTAILLHVDSPGGEVVGTKELADLVYAIRTEAGAKPLWAHVDPEAYSAGYWIASAAGRVILNDANAGVGSIGVIAVHGDVSRQLDAAGVSVTVMTSSRARLKDAFSPYKPLSEEAQGMLQAELDRVEAGFFGDVARNRGIREQAVADLEAQTLEGQDALDAKLADAIQPFDETLQELARAARGGTTGRTTMSMGTQDAETQASNVVSNDELERRRAEAKKEGHTAGEKAAEARMTALIELCSIDRGRTPEQAKAKAAELFAAGLSVDAARTQLASERADRAGDEVTGIQRATGAAPRLNVREIYEKRAAAIAEAQTKRPQPLRVGA